MPYLNTSTPTSHDNSTSAGPDITAIASASAGITTEAKVIITLVLGVLSIVLRIY